MKFDIENLKEMYLEKQKLLGKEAYKSISKLLQEAKSKHKETFFKREDVIEKQKKGVSVDHEQSWRAFSEF